MLTKLKLCQTKKQEIYAGHDEKWDKYWEEQNLIKRVEKMQKI